MLEVLCAAFKNNVTLVKYLVWCRNGGYQFRHLTKVGFMLSCLNHLMPH